MGRGAAGGGAGGRGAATAAADAQAAAEARSRRSKPPPPKPETRDADIAIEKAKAAEKEKREEQEREKLERQKAEKPEREKAAKHERDKAEKEKREAAAEAERVAKLREENLKRMLGQAGATGAPQSTGTAQRDAGPSASYAGKIIARVRPNIVLTDSVPPTLRAEVEVRAAPDGTITRGASSSPAATPTWDDAVLRAIDRTETLPKDDNGTRAVVDRHRLHAD